MRKFKHLFLFLLLLIFTGTPWAHAGVAIFFQGRPGMSPDEIIAVAGRPLRGPTPVDYEYTRDLGFDWYLAYNTKVMGFDAYSVYYFTGENGLQLVSVSIPLKNITLEKQRALFAEFGNQLVDESDPFVQTAETLEAASDGYRHIYYTRRWLNKTYFITMQASTSIGDMDARQNHVNISNVSLSFSFVQNANEATRLAIKKFWAEMAPETPQP